MNQSTLSADTLKPSNHSHGTPPISANTAEKAITVSELIFQTELPEQKHVKSPKNGLLFVFNLKDNINYSSFSTVEKRLLGSFESFMIANQDDQDGYIELNFPKSSSFHLCLLHVDKLENLGNFKGDFLQTNFQSEKTKHCWYTGIPNMKLSNFVKDLINLNNNFSENQHLLIGYTNIIIGLKLTEYSHFINEPKKQVDLRNDEINRIHHCINFIKENYAQQLDVDTLCLKFTLTPQKLQTGFRALYGNTVTSFIKNFRLQKAEELMRTTELNVSQIVYSIGFTSRSYFSKIFKEKYQTSPNDHMKKFKYFVA